MLLRNPTPFVPLLFQSCDVQGEMFCVLILRGTFAIVPHGVLVPDPEQRRIVDSDLFHGDPRTSSLYMESDLAPFKPRADIHVNAIAYPPGGYKARDWVVRGRVGALEKTLRVTGPRWWVKEGSGFRLTPPEPCESVPVRYEHAFGGVWVSPWGGGEVFEQNPAGVGFLKDGELPAEAMRAPQIEAVDDPIDAIGRAYRPQGFGPIARAWLPRRALAGTFDEQWRRTRWPELPLDFDFAHYNSAHPDLIYPAYLSGDEDVVLEGMHPEGELRFWLPGLELMLLVRFKGRAFRVERLPLDTLFIDVPDGRAHLTWRAHITAPGDALPVEGIIRVLKGARRGQA